MVAKAKGLWKGGTPGPWEADAMTGGSWCICRDEGAIADVWTNEADAHKIAAAPEMYEALAVAKMVVGAATASSKTHALREARRGVYERIEKALARAEGR